MMLFLMNMIRSVFFFTAFVILYGCQVKQKKSFAFNVSTASKLIEQGKDKEAIPYLNEAIENDSANFFPYFLIGRACFHLNDFDKSKFNFKKATLINDSFDAGYYYIGFSYYMEDRPDSAIFYFNKAIESKGSDSLYIELNKQLGKLALGAVDVSMPEIRFLRGESFYELKDFKKAFDDFSFCASEMYNLKHTYLYLGVINLTYRNKEEGCSLLLKAKELGNQTSVDYLDKFCK